MASASSNDPHARVPRLASSSSGGGGLPHAVWRPQMQTFLMRQGIEERDYTREIPQWKTLSAAVQADAEAEEQAAIAELLGAGKAASSGPAVKKEALTAEQQRAQKRVAELISRTRKACGYLYAALPSDLRLLV